MSDNPKPRLQLRDPNVFIPLALFVGALFFRLIGIKWGLANALHNQSYHPDELPIWSASQRLNPGKLNFTPGFYNYGTLYLTLLKVASDMVNTYGGSVPKDASGAWALISLCHLIGRVISAVAGAGMAAAMFPMMRRWTSTFGAVSAALLIAVAPAHVVHSRFQTVDIFAAFLLTLSTLYALKILPQAGETANDKPVTKNAVLSGVFAGLSTGTKYTGILGLLTLWTVLVMTRPRGWVLEGARGTMVALVAFVIATPGVLLDQEAFMRDFKFEMAHAKAGQIEFFHTIGGYPYHLLNLFYGVGFLMTAMGVCALLYAAVMKKKMWAIALLAFFVPYLVVIGSGELKFLRYTFPLYIAIAAGFGWAMGAANQRRGKFSAAVVIGFLGLGGVDTGGLRWAAVDTLQMAAPDARDVAGEFFKQSSVGGGKVVGLVSDPWYWTPALYGDTALPRSAGPQQFLSPMLQTKDPRVVRFFPPRINDRFDWDVRLLTDTRPDYVTFSNYETMNMERFKSVGNLLPIEKVQLDRYLAFADGLKKGYKLIQVDGMPGPEVPDLMYITPVIQIWKRNDLP